MLEKTCDTALPARASRPYARSALHLGTALIALGACALPALASAQSTEQAPPTNGPTLPETQQNGQTAQPPATSPDDAVPATAATTPDDSSDSEEARLKAMTKLLSIKGWETHAPTYDNTLTRDAGGWRSALADAGFGLSLYSLNVVAYDFAQAGGNLHGPQIYNGQKVTLQSSNQNAILTYDLGRVGLKGGQFSASVDWSLNGYQSRNGIRDLRIKGLTWHQPIFGGKVETDIGYIANTTYFMGSTVGGSLSGGALGPSAQVPVEAGLSFGQYDAPSALALIHWTKHLYTRSGIQRSISPNGSTAENDENPAGLTFSVNGAKALTVQEIGYQIDPDANHKYFWARAGGIYNWSDYKRIDGTGTGHNGMVFAAVDQQITQPDGDNPARGIYLGATFNGAPGSIDKVYRYYEGRAYVKGPFAGRPDDMLSVVIADSVYSRDTRDVSATDTFYPRSGTQTYTVGYEFRVLHGLSIQPGISVIHNPVFDQKVGTAVNGLVNFAIFL